MNRDLRFFLLVLVAVWFSMGPALLVGGVVYQFNKDWGVWVTLVVFGISLHILLDRKLKIEQRFDDEDTDSDTPG